MAFSIIPIKTGYVNSYLLKGENSGILIDAGLPGTEAQILNALDTNKCLTKDISLVVITHSHYDHFGSLAAIKKTLPALVASGKEDALALQAGQNADLVPLGLKGKIASLFSTRNAFTGYRPDILIDKEMIVSVGGSEVSIVPISGHTKGSLLIIAGENAFVGDLLMGSFFNFKKPMLPFFAVSLEAIKKSLSLLKERGVKILYLGHGGPIEASIAYEKYLR